MAKKKVTTRSVPARGKKKVVRKQVIKERKLFPINPWFRRRLDNVDSSWGIVPINWRGWVLLLAVIFLNVFSANYFDVMNAEFDEVSKTLVVFLLSIVVFILIAKKKTEGVMV